MQKLTHITLITSLLILFASSAFAAHHAVKTVHKDGVGTYLTDATGMALYWFTKDSTGVSSCSGGCLEKWPLYYHQQVVAPAGTDKSDFGTITRSDGQKQTTFRGYPLYYFFKDEMAGDTNGQGVKGVWYLIDPQHFPAN